MKKGLFITLEGTDGVGKTTQAKLLKTWLESLKKNVLLTREPGGGAAAERIRQILLDPQVEMGDLTELFLYEAARAEHMERVVRPALIGGAVVICDRFTDATLAYQGQARGLPWKTIQNLNEIATDGVKPDLTLWLDDAPEQGLEKARAVKGGQGDRLENEGIAFQKKVRAGYAKICQQDPRRVKRVQVQPTPEQTQSLLRALIKPRIKK